MTMTTEQIARDLAGWLHEYDTLGRDTRPDVDRELVAHLRTGIAFAAFLSSRRSDPFFCLGSDKTYFVRTNDGWRGVIVAWGNTDGHGLLVEPPRPSFVPMVADVLATMREYSCQQDDAVVILGGQP